jgi:hypothetical protein
MKKEKWSGVKLDREHLKKARKEKAIDIGAEILMFTLFLIFCAMLIAFILEIAR